MRLSGSEGEVTDTGSGSSQRKGYPLSGTLETWLAPFRLRCPSQPVRDQLFTGTGRACGREKQRKPQFREPSTPVWDSALFRHKL